MSFLASGFLLSSESPSPCHRTLMGEWRGMALFWIDATCCGLYGFALTLKYEQVNSRVRGKFSDTSAGNGALMGCHGIW